jgi:NADPH-dependent curcumin reductase CurA
MSTPTSTKVFLLDHHPKDHISLSGSDATFKLEERKLDELKDGEVLIETLYLSNDPAQRGWIDQYENEDRLYVPPVQIGQVMRAGGIYKILSSKNKEFPEGKLVRGFAGWAQYSVVKPEANGLQIAEEIPGISVTHYLGALGLTGLTAYFGLLKVGEAKKDDVIIVSGAAGATGSMVVQIAKHIVGAKKIIGLAGTDEKCRWVESIGADVCINYKGDWKAALTKETEGYANVYFDNVGGEQLNFALMRLGKHGRVVACGAIADYNASKDKKSGLTNWFDVIAMRLQLKGFIVLDFAQDFGSAIGELIKSVKAGGIKVGEANETVVESSFEDIPKTWTKLFEGGNQGKLVTKLV